MPAAPSKSSSDKPRVDVRTLSLTQLQKLAERGSRRAKAELEGRMRASGAATAAASPAPAQAPALASTSAPTPAPVRTRATAAAPVPPSPPAAPLAPAVAARQRLQAIPVLTERAATPAPAQPPATASGAPAPEAAPAQAVLEQLELIVRQEHARSRVDGPPRLVGIALLAWGALMGLGGLVTLSSGGGLYYFFCGLSSAAVGWLLLRCSRWALALHGLLLLLALGWAWRGHAAGNLMMTFIQAAPLLIPALWMLATPVREPLE